MNELTDEQIDEATLEILGFAALDSAQNITARMIARKVIAADRELQDARWREELNAYELRCSNLQAEIAAAPQPPAQPERKPMHEGEVQAAWLGQCIDEPLPYSFVLGIRSAERFNGIKDAP